MASLVGVALVVQFLPSCVAPRFAVDRAKAADRQIYRRLDTRGADPWGNNWRWTLNGPARLVFTAPGGLAPNREYSCGQNGVDEFTAGDDLFVQEVSGPWTVLLVGLWLLPPGLYLLSWILALRIARRAKERALGWRELGWAALTGGPAAAFALGYAWWGSDNDVWRGLLANQGGSLLGWRTSLVGAVVAALFVGGWALSRPPRRAEGWDEEFEPSALGADAHEASVG